MTRERKNKRLRRRRFSNTAVFSAIAAVDLDFYTSEVLEVAETVLGKRIPEILTSSEVRTLFTEVSREVVKQVPDYAERNPYGAIELKSNHDNRLSFKGGFVVLEP